MNAKHVEAAMVAVVSVLLLTALIYPIVAYWSCEARLSC